MTCGQDSRICQQFQDVDEMLEHGEECQIPMGILCISLTTDSHGVTRYVL